MSKMEGGSRNEEEQGAIARVHGEVSCGNAPEEDEVEANRQG